MLQLSLSWLGLGPVTASPWHLLLLSGASWVLARILAWIYFFYDNCCRLRCFPQPPKPNWFWGHLAMMKSNEEGMQLAARLGHIFRDIHLCWFGPVYPILRLTHPKFIAPLLQASGIPPRISNGLFPASSPSPSHTYTDQAEQEMKPYASDAMTRSPVFGMTMDKVLGLPDC